MIEIRNRLLLLCLLTGSMPVMSADTSLSTVSQTQWRDGQVATTALDESKRVERMAERWGVTPEAWTRYETIMQGEGQYHWKDVDPIMVLGMYAHTPQERERYAGMMADKEFRLQSQFIEFNKAYVNAFDERHGDGPILDLAAFYEAYRQRGIAASLREVSQQPVSLIGNTLRDRYTDWFERIRAQQAAGTSLDVYFIGETETSIGDWAKTQALDPDLIRRGIVTLNQDNGMYAQYGRPALPAAYYFDSDSQSTLQIQEEPTP